MIEGFEKFRDLVRKLDDLSFKTLDETDSETFIEIIEDLEEWGCKQDGHVWVGDQCGYWQHQFCINCRTAKYEDMAKQRCGDLTEKMGRMTEQEYLAMEAMP